VHDWCIASQPRKAKRRERRVPLPVEGRGKTASRRLHDFSVLSSCAAAAWLRMIFIAGIYPTGYGSQR